MIYCAKNGNYMREQLSSESESLLELESLLGRFTGGAGLGGGLKALVSLFSIRLLSLETDLLVLLLVLDLLRDRDLRECRFLTQSSPLRLPLFLECLLLLSRCRERDRDRERDLLLLLLRLGKAGPIFLLD